MPNHGDRRSWAIRGLIGAAVVVLALVVIWALFVPAADWLAHHDVGSATGPTLATARDAARGRLLTLGAGLLAAGALVFTARNFTLSREGQVTDRYTKAIEQLGSDKLDVRIGGIYALERIARDSSKDHPTVMEVLSAFIREHSREPWPPDTASSGRTRAARTLSGVTKVARLGGTVLDLALRSSSPPRNPPEQWRPPRPDVQAAVTVVGRRNAKRDIRRIDLTVADLRGVNLNRANLTRAYLFGANLTGGGFRFTNLTGADFFAAHLTEANLTGANLTGANLAHADLTGADLTGANLTHADLTEANLTGVDLTDANLTGADFRFTNLTDVRWPGEVPHPGRLDASNLRAAEARRLVSRANYLYQAGWDGDGVTHVSELGFCLGR